jgi:hypothetical protein
MWQPRGAGVHGPGICRHRAREFNLVSNARLGGGFPAAVEERVRWPLPEGSVDLEVRHTRHHGGDGQIPCARRVGRAGEASVPDAWGVQPANGGYASAFPAPRWEPSRWRRLSCCHAGSDPVDPHSRPRVSLVGLYPLPALPASYAGFGENISARHHSDVRSFC